MDREALFQYIKTVLKECSGMRYSDTARIVINKLEDIGIDLEVPK